MFIVYTYMYLCILYLASKPCFLQFNPHFTTPIVPRHLQYIYRYMGKYSVIYFWVGDGNNIYNNNNTRFWMQTHYDAGKTGYSYLFKLIKETSRITPQGKKKDGLKKCCMYTLEHYIYMYLYLYFILTQGIKPQSIIIRFRSYLYTNTNNIFEFKRVG